MLSDEPLLEEVSFDVLSCRFNAFASGSIQGKLITESLPGKINEYD
jgi:hypothetical protein